MQKVAYLSTEGRIKMDLVNTKSKARIYCVYWCIDNIHAWAGDIKATSLLSAQDFGSREAPASQGEMILREVRLISMYQFVHEITVEGQTSIKMHYRDILPRPWDVVCPITFEHFTSLGTMGTYCRVEYDVLPASYDEIVDIAAQQGLRMEV